MSLAWGGVVLLLLLLPGFLFFTGLYIPETFTRETAERSPLGQLAGSLLVSVFVHAALVAGARAVCQYGTPCVSFRHILAAATLDGKNADATNAVASSLENYWFYIGLYVVLASALGLAGGYFVGRNAVRGGFCRFLAQHPWVHRLSVGDSLTIAYVMTTVRQDRQVLLYRGFLEAFGIQKTGQFSYLAIKGARRGYMRLDEDGAHVESPETWRTIGDGPATKDTSQSRSLNLFVVEGTQIANVVFEKFEIAYGEVTLDSLAELVRKIHEEMAHAPSGSNLGA